MRKVLILGASGSLARVVIPVLLANPDIKLTLFSRHITSLSKFNYKNVSIIQGDVMDFEQLANAMQAQDIVYANLAGQLELMAKNIVQAMNLKNVKRLIWISSMGIYGETGEDHGAILVPYQRSAQIIEDSNLDYTIIRPAWFTDDIAVDYKLTRKGEAFQGHQVSRCSIAALINKLIEKPDCAIGESLGIAKV